MVARVRESEREMLSEHEPPGSPCLQLLHAFQLRTAGEVIHMPVSAQRLVAFLALRGGLVLRRSHVAGTLWTESTEEHASASLRSALWRLRRPGIDIIEATSDGLWLSSTVWVDVWESEALARRLVDMRSPWVRTGREVEFLTADLLPDWYEGWVLVERERLRQLRLHALESLCRRLMWRGEFADAVQAGLAAVAGDPLRESAQRTLIEAHLAEGNRIEALRQYDRFRDLLSEELKVEPSDHLKALVLAP